MTNDTVEVSTVIDEYLTTRKKDLSEKATFLELVNRVARLEIALMDLLDSVLDSDQYPDMAIMSVPGHLPKLDKNALTLLKGLDDEGEYEALWEYISDEQPEK